MRRLCNLPQTQRALGINRLFTLYISGRKSHIPPVEGFPIFEADEADEADVHVDGLWTRRSDSDRFVRLTFGVVGRTAAEMVAPMETLLFSHSLVGSAFVARRFPFKLEKMVGCCSHQQRQGFIACVSIYEVHPFIRGWPQFQQKIII